MLGVPKELIEHALKVDPKATPKKQRLRRFSPDKREAIKKELAKLLAAGFIKEVCHPDWLAKVVELRPEEEQQRVEDVRRLHQSKQALPKGSFRATTY